MSLYDAQALRQPDNHPDDLDELLPILCPIADAITKLLEADWAPHDLQEKVRELVTKWEAGEAHQRQLADWMAEDIADEMQQLAEGLAEERAIWDLADDQEHEGRKSL